MLGLLLLGWLSASPANPPPDSRPTLAVLYFDHAGSDSGLDPLRKGLTQMLISDLTQLGGARVVERERLEAVLTELKLSRTSTVDPATAARAGKLLGAHYLILGSYFQLKETLRIDARLVEVETGRVVAALGATGKDGDFLGPEQELAQRLAERIMTLPKAARAPSPKEAAIPPRRLRVASAVTYGRALQAIDSGRRDEARSLIKAVLKEEPDFQLAAQELDKLVQ